MSKRGAVRTNRGGIRCRPVQAKTCKRSRDFLLKLINWRFYTIAGALTANVQHALQEAGKVSFNTAAVENLSVAIHKRWDFPDQVALAHRSTTIRSRVIIHRSYAASFPNRQDQIGADFQTILRSIDDRRAYGIRRPSATSHTLSRPCQKARFLMLANPVR
ncbi:hypothetical protein QN219_27460 [Sinorhizobium sp. 7-81]|nr:hypothetical protein [Sinorhizobium sp. 8-89]